MRRYELEFWGDGSISRCSTEEEVARKIQGRFPTFTGHECTASADDGVHDPDGKHVTERWVIWASPAAVKNGDAPVGHIIDLAVRDEVESAAIRKMTVPPAIVRRLAMIDLVSPPEHQASIVRSLAKSVARAAGEKGVRYVLWKGSDQGSQRDLLAAELEKLGIHLLPRLAR
jgi:hypothetical protein